MPPTRSTASRRSRRASAGGRAVPRGRQVARVRQRLAANLYRNAALAVRVVGTAAARSYPGHREQALTTAARGLWRLLHFVNEVVRQTFCPVQREAFSVLARATKVVGVYVREGMTKDETIDHAGHDDTRRRLELALEGRTPQDAERDRCLNDLRYDLGRFEQPDELGEVGYVLDKVDRTVARLLELGLGPPRDPQIAAVSSLVDDEEYDPERHAAITRVADAELPDENGTARAGEARDTHGFTDVLATNPDRWTNRLVFALNNRSIMDYHYARPGEIEFALDWLAGEYRDARLGVRPRSLEELQESLRIAGGWHYRSHQSSTTVGKYRDWYECTWDGRPYDIHAHIGRGNTKRMTENSIRLAFAWDEERQVVVVGFVGQHQRTTAT